MNATDLCECELERAAVLEYQEYMLRHYAEVEARKRNRRQPMCSECPRGDASQAERQGP